MWAIFLSAILTDNVILARLFGADPILSKHKMGTVLRLSGAVTLVMVVATALTWPLYGILSENGLSYLKVLAFMAVIVLVSWLVAFIFRGLGTGAIMANSGILGVTLLNVLDGLSFWDSLVRALGTGLGFLVVLAIFVGVQERLETAPVPESFKGAPITLITAALLAISFFGFNGIG